VKLRTRLLLWLVALFALGPVASRAQDLTYLPLQRPGQASVAVDRARQIAFVIDLGADRQGTELLFEGEPLLDRLEKLGVRQIVFSCSHPHADHMGGIKALFADARNFLRDGPDGKKLARFDAITVVDDIVVTPTSSRPLFTQLSATLGRKSPVKVAYERAAGRNAFAALSAVNNAVFIENIPYTPASAAGVHGRSLVTRIVLGGRYSILDFDDADSAVIKQVVSTLKSREVTIDAFVVPHHGSAYHEIAPILELSPKSAIITVNPRNRYGHPAPTILRELMSRLQPENVLFTGSIGRIELGPSGIVNKVYTAASRQSYELFVLPSELRTRANPRNTDAAVYAEVRAMMQADPGNRPSAPAKLDVKTLRTDEAAETSVATVRDRIVRTGTILSDEHAVGTIERSGTARQQFATDRVLNVTNTAGPTRAVVPDVFADGVSSAANAERLTDRVLIAGGSLDTPVDASFESAAGLTNGLEPPGPVVARTPRRAGPTGPTGPAGVAAVPDGGMVYLTGGKLLAMSAAGQLSAATLDVCGVSLCLRPHDAPPGAAPYTVPFSPDPLFSEVWRKTYDEAVGAFYLSINPTKQFLQQLDARSKTVPTGQLQYGTGLSQSGLRNNEVITAGGIEKSIIGDILWKADVAFKSASLGFNVLTGTKFIQTTGSLVALGDGDADDFDTDYENRWCRLYWASGTQQIRIDGVSRAIRFSGDALIAHAEAMELVNGELKDEPKGTWCAEAKRVASQLQVAANARRSTFAELNQLQRVAEAQNFARWAAENGVQTTAAFRKALQPSPAIRVPSWTSGVRSEPQQIVQVEQRLTANPWVLRLHFGTTDISVMTPCVSSAYGPAARAKALTAMGIKKDESGVWRYTDRQKPLFAKWMNSVATEIAKCSQGVVLPPSGNTPDDLDVMTDSGSLGGLTGHAEPVHIHGGILLGKFADLARRQMLADGLVLLPDGRMLFRSVRGELHFWNVATANGNMGAMSQHVTLTAGSVIDSEATNNHLRVLVKGRAGALLRQELRVHRAPTLSGGLEWLEARFASDSETVANKAVWSCDDLASLCVADVKSSELGALLGASEDNAPPISVKYVGPDLWVIDLDISHVRALIDAQANSLRETDSGRGIGVVSQYATWGFIDEAEALQEKLLGQLEGDSADYILSRELTTHRLHEAKAEAAQKLQVAIGVAMALTDADNPDQIRKLWTMLVSLERLADGLPPSESADFWSLQRELLEFIEETAPSAVRATTLATKKKLYDDRANQSRWIAEGASNPWATAQ
jgi:beta-lactamase superfamily II metal-dependent hydrolase